MPLYEYRCLSCGKTLEVIQKFSDKPLKKHEGCGGELERLVSAPAIQFKGTGWYVTDYARGNGRSGSNGTSKGKKPTETKTETKPAATAPADK